MKFGLILPSISLILLVVAIWFSKICHNPSLPNVLGSIRIPAPFLLMYSLFSIILFSIIIESYKPYSKEDDQDSTPLYLHEEGEYSPDHIKRTPDEESDYEDYHGSDGYEVDDQNDVYESGDDDDVTWDDEERFDENLQKRVEDFIAKVTDGWKEEKMRDKSTLFNEYRDQ